MTGFWRLFGAAAERWPERPALLMQRRDDLETCSYMALRRQAEAVAACLHGRGLVRGERCAIFAENGIAWVAAYLAILRLGGVVVPIDRNYAPEQAARLIEDCGARLLLASDRCLDAAARAGAACRPAVAAVPLASLVASAAPDPAPPPVAVAASDPAMILYTSGTTADPKGVVLSHDNLLGAIDAMYRALSFDETDCSLGVLPFSHILGQMAGILLPLPVGASVVLLDELSAPEMLRALREQGVTVLCGVPQLFATMRDRILGEIRRAGVVPRLLVGLMMRANGGLPRAFGRDLGRRLFRRVHDAVGPRLRYLVSAGAPLDRGVVRDFERLGFTLLEAYGLTETTGAVTMTPLGEDAAGNVGRALTGGAVAILSSDGEPLDAGAEGEIALRGRMLMAGYYNRPEETAAAVVDGWLRTGDLGMVDGQGRLHVTGRSKDLIVLGSGRKVQPEAVERRLEASPFIKEVCVLGRRQGAHALGDTLHAVIVPEMGAFRERHIGNIQPTLRHEIDTLSVGYPAAERVAGFTVSRSDLPRTTTRKIRRHVVRAELAAAAPAADDGERRDWSDADRAWAAQSGIAPALRLVQQALGAPVLPHPEDSLELDFGVDSLRRVELVMALERRGGVKLTNQAALACYTVRELAEAIAAAATATVEAVPVGEWDALDETAAGTVDVAGLGQAGLVLDAIRFVVLKTLRGAARLLLRFDLRGLENLPQRGPLILAVNHQSYLDALIVLSALPHALARRTVMLGKPKYVGSGWRGRVARRLNMAAIDADANLGSAMRLSAQMLREGKALLLFPEGERSIDGELGHLRRGAAILACHGGVPVVPAVIDGTHRVWPRGRAPQRLSRVGLRFTAPLDLPPGAAADFNAATVALTAQLQQRFETVLGEMRAPPPVPAPASRVSIEPR
jgi:long-chain acyl-CoA synthetase